MAFSRKTKIVATIGPATSSKEKIEELILAGMNVARLNFSHGTHAEHLKVIGFIRELNIKLKTTVAILQDLQGPKIRVEGLGLKGLVLEDGDLVIVGNSRESYEGNEKYFISDFENLVESCEEDSLLLIDDGLIDLLVTKKTDSFLFCEVIHGGLVKNRKGINIPGAQLPIQCLTEKDLIDLEFGLMHNVDYIALSFVRKSEDIVEIKKIIKKIQVT